MYKLIALDLDDTLLGHDGLIGPEHKAAIAAARAAGCDVTLVTARAWPGTRRFVEELGLTAPVICLTGSAVYSPQGEPLRQQGLAPGEIRRLVARADAEGWSIRLYYADGFIVHSCPAADFAPKSPMFPVDRYVGPVSPWLDRRETPLQAALLGHRAVEGALALLAELPGMVDTTYERFTPAVRTHIMQAGVTKGSALAAYCQERSIPREAVVAMGDSEPDRSMIEWAGTGVAMGWAPESVRRAADLVMDATDPAPVATAIRRLFPSA